MDSETHQDTPGHTGHSDTTIQDCLYCNLLNINIEADLVDELLVVETLKYFTSVWALGKHELL